jgi:uncharacterized membrane protein YfcA
MSYIAIFLTGVAVAFISTLFGLGGGIIMVPILSLILPYSHLEAVATSLMTIVLVAAFNTYNFSEKNVIVWSVVPWIAIPSALIALVSAHFSPEVPEKILVVIFIAFLLWVASRTFLLHPKSEQKVHLKNSKFVPMGIGGLSGLISGMTGVGGGGITTPLMLVSGLAKNIQAAPTSNAIMIFTTLFGSISYALADYHAAGYLTLGYIHFDTALFLFAGSATFSRIGVRVNQEVSLFWRKTVLGAILLIICFRLLFLLI